MPLSDDVAVAGSRRWSGCLWRALSVVLFGLIILFSFVSLANIDKLSRESADAHARAAIFEAWLREHTEYVAHRDAEWNARFERIDTREAERREIFARIEKLLDEIDARKSK